LLFSFGLTSNCTTNLFIPARDPADTDQDAPRLK
jgi:hypothetical protein